MYCICECEIDLVPTFFHHLLDFMVILNFVAPSYFYQLTSSLENYLDGSQFIKDDDFKEYDD